LRVLDFLGRLATNDAPEAVLAPNLLLAIQSGGILYAFTEATLEGKLVLAVLFIASIFSWSVMITKMRTVRLARKQNELFLQRFRADRQPLRIYESQGRFDGSPLFSIYRAGCRELTLHLLGATEVDETFRARLDVAERITPSQMNVVTSAMERAVGESALRLEAQMILLATAVSGAPFLGLLGTVWGVMDTFTGVALAGSASLQAMAPGVSGALVTTVTGLLVAIPAMFGYNFLVTSIRSLIVQTDNFAAELASEFEHKYVNHGSRSVFAK
jgi:biopolymer transport protein TolQ